MSERDELDTDRWRKWPRPAREPSIEPVEPWAHESERPAELDDEPRHRGRHERGES